MLAKEFTVKKIFRYPVKGLSPQKLDTVQVEPNETLPWDRAFAIENGHSGFDEKNPKYLPKQRFLMLMKNEDLVKIRTEFNDNSQILKIWENEKLMAEGSLVTESGRELLEEVLSNRFKQYIHGKIKILHAPNHSFSDISEKVIHLVNLNTVRNIEEKVNKSINPLRFRANVYVDGLPAWKEFDLIGRESSNGQVELKGLYRTQRCAATNVNPDTGERDMNIPINLMENFNHSDFGIYLKVTKGGSIFNESKFEIRS